MAYEFQPLINGAAYSGASIGMNIGGTTITGLRGINWTKKQTKKNAFAAGTNPNSRVYQQKDPDGDFVLLLSQYHALEAAAPNFDVLDIPPFPIVVTYLQGTRIVSYTLHNADITEVVQGGKTTDGELEVKLKFIFSNEQRTR